MPLASHERSRSMGPLQGFRRGPVVPTTSPQGAFRNSLRKLKLFSFTPASPSSHAFASHLRGSPKIIPQNSLRDFCGSPEIIPQNSLRDFCGSPEIIPQNSLRDFCGSPENERHGWRSFFVRQGWEAAFTTLPPLFVRHPPLHREGYNKVTPSAARPFCGRAAPPSAREARR